MLLVKWWKIGLGVFLSNVLKILRYVWLIWTNTFVHIKNTLYIVSYLIVLVPIEYEIYEVLDPMLAILVRDEM